MSLNRRFNFPRRGMPYVPELFKIIYAHHDKADGSDMEAVQRDPGDMVIALGKDRDNAAAENIAYGCHNSAGDTQRDDALCGTAFQA